MRSFERSSDLRNPATLADEKEDSMADFTALKVCGSEIGSTGC
jgi:hypothetical protein